MSTTLEIRTEAASVLVDMLPSYEGNGDYDREIIAIGLAAAFDIVSKAAAAAAGDPRRQPQLHLAAGSTLEAHIGILAAAKMLNLENELRKLTE